MSVIKFPDRRGAPRPPSHEPFLNLPPWTARLGAVMALVSGALLLLPAGWAGPIVAWMDLRRDLFLVALTTGDVSLLLEEGLSALTFPLVPEAWLELLVSLGIVLVAGAFAERTGGARRLFQLVLAGSLASAAVFLLAGPDPLLRGAFAPAQALVAAYLVTRAQTGPIAERSRWRAGTGLWVFALLLVEGLLRGDLLRAVPALAAFVAGAGLVQHWIRRAGRR